MPGHLCEPSQFFHSNVVIRQPDPFQGCSASFQTLNQDRQHLDWRELLHPTSLGEQTVNMLFVWKRVGGPATRLATPGDLTVSPPPDYHPQVSTPAIVPQQPNQSLPAQMRAGDLFAWTVQTTLAAGSTVNYVLTAIINNAPVRITVASVTVDATGLAAFSLASSVTSAWTPGRYLWVCFAFDLSGNRTELAQGSLAVMPDVGGTAPVDPRTRNERMLANIRCVMEGKTLEDVLMYKIGTRELTKMSHKDLLYFEGILTARVRRERRKRGEFVPTNTIGITFGGR